MFLQYYGLREQPFSVTPDPRFLYFSATHREALASLYYGIESGCGFLTLIAPPGMGKTTLLFHLLEKLRGSAQTVFLFQTQCGSREFFRYLLTDLGADTGEQNLARMHESLNAVLLRNARVGRRVVLVIDEAQNLEDSVLETVRLFSDFETPQAKLLQIVLAGQPQLADKLSHPALVQLRQRISIMGRLHPFTRVETMVYLEYRLRMAGCSGGPLFRYDAADLIAAQSGGIPRIINNICFNALTLGFAKRQSQIDASVVHEVLADLEIERLGTHPLAPGQLAKDSLSSFDGLSPTDEASFQEFHNAVCTAWEKGTEVILHDALVETAAQLGSQPTPQVVSQELPGNNGHGRTRQDIRRKAQEHSLDVPASAGTAVRGKNKQALAVSASLAEAHWATLQSADRQQSHEPPKPISFFLPWWTERIGIWARALAMFAPLAHKKTAKTVFLPVWTECTGIWARALAMFAPRTYKKTAESVGKR
jgi:general secretion pathway protein A